MDEPIYDAVTEDYWSRLPEHYRLIDATTNWTMKAYIASMADDVNALSELLDAIDYDAVSDGGQVGDSSALVDPDKAPTKWLPWIAQVYGVPGVLANDEGREVLQASGTKHDAGTKESIENSVKPELVGSRYVAYYPRQTNQGAGGLWDGLIITRDTETLKNLMPLYMTAGNISALYTSITGDPVTQIANYSYEQDSVAPAQALSAATDVSLSYDWTRDGDISLQLRATGQDGESGIRPIGTISGTMTRMNWEPGETYTVSVWVGVLTPITTTGMQLQAIAEGPGDDIVLAAIDVENTAGDKLVPVTFTIPSDATECYLKFMMNSNTEGDQVYLDLWETSSGSGESGDFVIYRTDRAVNPNFYNRSAFLTEFESYPSNKDYVIRLRDRIKPPADDPLTFMYSVESNNADAVALNLKFYDDSGNLISEDMQAYVQLVPEEKAEIFYQTNTPAGTASAIAEWYIKAPVDGTKFYIGELGFRVEAATAWLPRSADPIQAVINRGAKPAGLVLYHKTFSTTWDKLENAKPTWDDWEAPPGNWVSVEEIGN